ncbi:MAG: epoxyqueuosine reductase QueH [bacterium]
MHEKMLIHVCCGPCVAAILDELKRNFDLIAFYYNPNIYPLEEYEKRRDFAKKICTSKSVAFIEGNYNNDEWTAWAKDYALEPEGGARCKKCFAFRLSATASKAFDLGFQWIASTLTSGRNKKADLINNLGKLVADEKGLKFYEEDWKKKGRQEASQSICLQEGIYRQNYCGCIYSLS